LLVGLVIYSGGGRDANKTVSNGIKQCGRILPKRCKRSFFQFYCVSFAEQCSLYRPDFRLEEPLSFSLGFPLLLLGFFFEIAGCSALMGTLKILSQSLVLLGVAFEDQVYLL